jgi:hypothetical protein
MKRRPETEADRAWWAAQPLAIRQACHRTGWQPGDPVPWPLPDQWTEDTVDLFYVLLGAAHREARTDPATVTRANRWLLGSCNPIRRWVWTDEGPWGIYPDKRIGWDSLDAGEVRVLAYWCLLPGPSPESLRAAREDQSRRHPEIAYLRP